jgi:hypothetical protein
MKRIASLISFLLILSGCITQFVPQTNENPELLVVEALISNGDIQNVKLGSSLPLGVRSKAKPVSGCYVRVTDDMGRMYNFFETDSGNYLSSFVGEKGRFYTLHIRAGSGASQRNYESYPMEMKPVPPIDSLYYEKVMIAGTEVWPKEGAQIYLDTKDPTNLCNFFRWKFSETWQFQLPYEVPNQTCWIESSSQEINIKSTTALAESNIVRYPINFISNETDRLKIKYSMLVSQYSLTEDEYTYWERLQKLSEQVGGLYDIIPSSVPGNVYCIENPDERVLGYFSVSATVSKRIFVKDNFQGIANRYTASICVADTLDSGEFIPHLNETVWVIIQHYMPDYKVITYSRDCADCTTRGTTEEPPFWREDQ